MSWSYLPESAPCQPNGSKAGEPYAMWSGLSTRLQLLRHESETGCLMMRQSGMMSEHLTAVPGAASFISLRRDFLANRSALPEKDWPEMIPATDGLIPFVLLEKSSPNSSYWRTYQDCLPGLMDISAEYSESWPRAGMVLDGVCYLRPNWERPTNEIGSGLWATPNSSDAVGSHGGGQSRSLRTDIWNWKQGLWPTPTVSGNHNRKGLTEKSGDGLETAVKMFPTPTAVTNTGGAAMSKWGGSGSRKRLEEMAKNGQIGPEEVHGALNPDWVEWLMGWPIGWTDLKPLEMERFRQWLRQHGIYLPGSAGRD